MFADLVATRFVFSCSCLNSSFPASTGIWQRQQNKKRDFKPERRKESLCGGEWRFLCIFWPRPFGVVIHMSRVCVLLFPFVCGFSCSAVHLLKKVGQILHYRIHYEQTVLHLNVQQQHFPSFRQRTTQMQAGNLQTQSNIEESERDKERANYEQEVSDQTRQNKVVPKRGTSSVTWRCFEHEPVNRLCRRSVPATESYTTNIFYNWYKNHAEQYRESLKSTVECSKQIPGSGARGSGFSCLSPVSQLVSPSR